ncbi:cell division protein ZipA [Microbulbifer bruguierae]|uniref:Cell division protein ZipA n=1 Tax=Microbulbifer bruguierae TaxID=3029061 RepID=A0ABY8NEQ2_9GAMM|nr:cell division protein ZipA [Microbulbifer bruguierae]WGL17414.1 cell division protein ZipA [Microbulbifer bruguierae]
MDNWLINLLALVVFAVVLDGARRAYLKHRDSVKVSRKLSRSMRRDLDDYDNDILSPARPVEPAQDVPMAAPNLNAKPGTTPAAKPVPKPLVASAASPIAESELEFIDPQEAEKRRQILAELPGTVRVVQRRKPEDASQVNRQVQQNFQSSRKPLAGSKPDRSESEGAENMTTSRGDTTRAAIPEQAALNLDDQVPTLMDSVVEESATGESMDGHTRAAAGGRMAVASASDSLAPEFSGPAVQEKAAEELEAPILADRREPSLDESVSLETLQAIPEEEVNEDPEGNVAQRAAEQEPTKSAWASAEIKLPELKFPELKKNVAPKREARAQTAADKRHGDKRDAVSGKRPERAVEEVLILNIMAPENDCFEGNDLLRVLLSSGLRFGDMNIFHYHCGEAGEGPALFSLANIVVPGTFDMSEMEDFTTPGISLFLALPAEVEALKAFDTLLHAARSIAEQLGGELKDENRSVFTAQTAEHYRQRVMEFQRRKALARAQA